jgi:DDE superfamily endonuclease
MDLSKSTVLDPILTELNKSFASSSQNPRFVKMEWTRQIPYHSKKTNSSQVVHARRPYIKDIVTGTIMTVQNKAWMDTVGLLMWLDTQLKPFVDKHGKLVIVWDNVSSHANQYLKEQFELSGVILGFLPKYMTSLLQVIDIIINGPLKSDQRHQRAAKVFTYVDNYTDEFNEAELSGNEKSLPEYDPSPISLTEGIVSLMDTIFKKFKDNKFVDSVKRCFQKVGIVPNDNGTRNVYHSGTHSSVKFIPEPYLQDSDVVQAAAATGDSDTAAKTLCNEVMELIDVTTRNNACPEDVEDNSNKYVTGNVEYEIGPPQLPQQIGARATVINTVHRGAESSLPTFNAEEIDSMTRLTLKGHLLKRGYSSCQMVKAVSTDEQLRVHLKDWCETETKRANKGVATLTMDLTNDDTVVSNNHNTLSSESNVLPRQVPINTQTIAEATATSAGNCDLKYCFCQKTYGEDNAPMIECSSNNNNKNIKIKQFCLSKGSTNSWFHNKCLESKNIPLPKHETDDWYCPPCAIMRQYTISNNIIPEAVEVNPRESVAEVSLSRSSRKKNKVV